MTQQSPYSDVVILIPSHSLEDFPVEQDEGPAAGLLNAFAVAWHPLWLAGMAQLPRWHRADDPPRPVAGQLVIIPEICAGTLPCGWVESAREAGAIVLDQLRQRDELLAAALAPLEPRDVDSEFVADFQALGTGWLMVELLSRQMRNFGNIDDIRLQNRAIAAAKGVLAEDRETATAHLRASFEILQQAREQFYPVESYLLDLCLVVPDVADDRLLAALQRPEPLNVLVTAKDLARIDELRPDILDALRDGVTAGRVELIGAEWDDSAAPVLPLASWLHGFHAGAATYRRLGLPQPRVWGRRRFGLSPAWPQLLRRFGYQGALHVMFDDGIYPDEEYSRFRWQGHDESTVNAFSRIPLAADAAPTFLRLPQRLGESMDHDHVAAICLARWPDVTAPWLDDLVRMRRYAPVLGTFTTFREMFATPGATGKLVTAKAGDYFTPFLLQHVARREADPLTRYADHQQRRLRYDVAEWCRRMTCVLQRSTVEQEAARQFESRLERVGPDRTSDDDVAAVEQDLSIHLNEAATSLARGLVPKEASGARGVLLLNPYRFGRRLTIPWPADAAAPAVTGVVRGLDPAADGGTIDVTVDVPGFGFAWLATPPGQPRAGLPAPVKGTKALPAVEPWILRNELFELSFSEATGGVRQVRHPRKRENRFSQLLSFRYPRERQLPATDDAPATKSQYAATRCLGHEPVRTTGARLELATFGEIVDQLTGQKLAGFRQVTRLDRWRPVIEFEITLSDVVVPTGDPWNQYFCVRFAWDDSAAAVTRSLLDGAANIGGERFETTEYIEIAGESERLTIIPHGLPYHRKSGPRMLDSLLVVTGERRRTFRFSVAIDQPYPLESAREATAPVLAIPMEQGFAAAQTSGWLFHLDARNVQLVSLEDPCEPPADDAGDPDPCPGKGVTLRLLETEGQRRVVRLRTYRTPASARKRDPRGVTLQSLPLDSETIVFELRPHELADIEVRFA